MTGLAKSGASILDAATQTEQYALKAVEPGFYPVMVRGHSEPQGGVWLEAGDV